jgi:chemotaxis-related protein WspB
MLMVLCYVDENKYTIEGEYVVEVIPHVLLKEVLHAPKFILGLLNYGGVPVPIIDLCYLVKRSACDRALHSRIIIVKFTTEDAIEHLFGILAEKVTETIDREPSLFIDAGIRVKDLPFLGKILNEEGETIQMLNIPALFNSLHGALKNVK